MATCSPFFFENFNSDNGAGLGASHQTGWTDLVARMIQLFSSLDYDMALKAGSQAKILAYRKDQLA